MYPAHLPSVSVIIPVHNDPERLQICLTALEQQTYPSHDYEVIVIDNASTDSIQPIVARFAHAQAEVEPLLGSFRARNTGIALAHGDVLAFLDADCIPALDWIEQGVKRLVSIPNCGIVGGKVDLFFKNPEHPTAVELYDRLTYLDQKNHIEKQNFSATANLFTWKKIFTQVGVFTGNQNSLDDSDDKEWGQRVASAGYALAYAEEVCVAHPARYSFTQLMDKEKRVARGSATVTVWRGNLPPLTWRYESILDHLPLLPPVKKAMSLRNVSFSQKMLVIGIGCCVTYIQIQEKIRAKLQNLTGQWIQRI